MTTILPSTIDTMHIDHIGDLTSDRTAVVKAHPFRAPHHTISDAGLIGGGRGLP